MSRYLLTPVAGEHDQQSRQLIRSAAQLVQPGRVAILGAGRCAEIPLVELAARFEQVTLNDVDGELLKSALAETPLDGRSRSKVELHVADLTGTTQSLCDKFDAILAGTASPAVAAEAMAVAVEQQVVAGIDLAGPFDLVVASCMLSQLHGGVVHGAASRFERRFAGHSEQLRANDHWKVAIYELARRMEDCFIADLVKLVAPGGLIYLSESVQVCHITLTDQGQWATEGTYRLLRTKELADYFGAAFTIVGRARWQWVFAPAGVGQSGKLFDVQAVLARIAP